MSAPQQRLVFLGPPGAGKGTQAERLSARLGVPHISTGEILRAEIDQGTELGTQAKAYMDEGDLVPDELISDIVAHRIEQDDCRGGFILDGYPRSLAQAKSLERHEAEGASLRVVSFAVPEEQLVERMVARGRSDDREDVIHARFVVYQRETAPLLDFYRGKSALVEIDGVGAPDEVFGRLLEGLGAGGGQ